MAVDQVTKVESRPMQEHCKGRERYYLYAWVQLEPWWPGEVIEGTEQS
jgi:hypothetical protein